MDAKAFVLIANESGTEDSVLSNLNGISSVMSAFGTFGAYDIIAKLESENEENIQKDISNKIRKISNNNNSIRLPFHKGSL